METVDQKVEITLHDKSLVAVSRTKTGRVYLELYAPGMARDGHGLLLKGSALVSEEIAQELRALLTEGEIEHDFSERMIV